MVLSVLFLVHCFFFIYINDLSDNLESNVKLFADDTSMSSVVRDPINTSQKLNNDLDKVFLWANKWKMSSSFRFTNNLPFFYETPSRLW